MSSNPPHVVTTEVIEMVEHYVYRELDKAKKYDNSEILDEWPEPFPQQYPT